MKIEQNENFDIVAVNAQRFIKTKNLKQKDVAQKTGLSEKQLSAIFCGRKRVSTNLVLKLCAVLDVTPNELYGYE